MSTEKVLATLSRGKSFFDQVIEDGSYYVDKTLFIKDLMDGASAVTFCTRPRRFGKTLNQTMLKCFFEDTAPKRDEALKQIVDGKYAEELENECYNDVVKYGVAFCRKSCEVGKLE